MKLRNLNYLVGFGLLIALVCFFFYKSIFSDRPLTETLATINEIQDLQVQLHRDLLRYRNNQILQYDTLNQTLFALDSNMVNLQQNEIARSNIGTVKFVRNTAILEIVLGAGLVLASAGLFRQS